MPDRRRHLVTEGYSMAISTSHPLARRESVRAEELVDEPMIVRRHCELLPETSRFFTTRGIRPVFHARTTSDDKALSYVGSGLGLTIMPECFRGEEVARVHVDGFDFVREIGVIFLEDGKGLSEVFDVLDHAVTGP